MNPTKQVANSHIPPQREEKQIHKTRVSTVCLSVSQSVSQY